MELRAAVPLRAAGLRTAVNSSPGPGRSCGTACSLNSYPRSYPRSPLAAQARPSPLRSGGGPGGGSAAAVPPPRAAAAAAARMRLTHPGSLARHRRSESRVPAQDRLRRWPATYRLHRTARHPARVAVGPPGMTGPPAAVPAADYGPTAGRVGDFRAATAEPAVGPVGVGRLHCPAAIRSSHGGKVDRERPVRHTRDAALGPGPRIHVTGADGPPPAAPSEAV